MAFLDIMPLTRGHVLVVPREHCPTLGDVGVRVGREVCSPPHPDFSHVLYVGKL